MAIQAEIKNNKLVVTLDLEAPRMSKSGLTKIVASTGGPQRTEAKIGDNIITVNAQAWIK